MDKYSIRIISHFAEEETDIGLVKWLAVGQMNNWEAKASPKCATVFTSQFPLVKSVGRKIQLTGLCKI